MKRDPLQPPVDQRARQITEQIAESELVSDGCAVAVLYIHRNPGVEVDVGFSAVSARRVGGVGPTRSQVIKALRHMADQLERMRPDRVYDA